MVAPNTPETPAKDSAKRTLAALKRNMTARQRRFVDFYLGCNCNATKAAKMAGYAEKDADVQGPRLLGYVGIRQAINLILESEGFTPEFVKEKLQRYAGARLSDYEPWLLGAKSLTELEAEGISTTLVKSATISAGKYGETRRIELYDGQKAVETLAKLHGLAGDEDAGDDTPDGLEVTEKVVIKRYQQRAGKPVDLGIAGIAPLNRLAGNNGAGNGAAHGGNGHSD